MLNRRELCRRAVGAGLAAGCLGPDGAGTCLAQTAGAQHEKSPCEKRLEWTENWTRRFFETLDGQVDEASRRRLMTASGRACYRESHAGRAVKPMPVDELVSKLQAYAGETNCRREGDTVYFTFKPHPEHRCLCPLVETGPAKLSPTFCLCSVGYVTQMFESCLGRPVRVAMLESIHTGGTACRFQVELA